MVLLRLIYNTEGKPSLSDLSALLYDYELLHDYLVLSTMEEYSEYTFPRYFWYRSRGPLAKEERMQIRTVHYGSPLIWVPILVSWVAVKIVQPLVQISGEIADWPSDRRKAKAEAAIAQLTEIEKISDIEYKQMRNKQLKLLIEQEEYKTEMTRMELEELQEQRELGKEVTLRRITQRLSKNPYQLEDITIQPEVEEGKDE